ncbi:glycosyltransferase family 2 protein [Zooshikella harenae]|uniref:Glycosyltransferase family 2 protein n=1 Tax=Zooshikella harenae TaxID=2827238 RepID=A0ABS5Z8J8_9GAMM|nr:glycosyltransferase family 2 protein [Zooshikella harenae]MBU2710375.1 glycosyltransferase family 2 protein [Zooshikella harenae]
MFQNSRSPKVSILIPVYNRANFIKDCIQSALYQTYSDFEVIVIDNASNDGTWDILTELSKYDDRIKIHKNSTNIGPLRNLVFGIAKCRGEYVKILFSDDLMARNCLEKMVYVLANNSDTGIVISNIKTIRDQTNDNSVKYNFENGKLSSVDYIEKALLSNSIPLSPGSCLFRKKDILKNYIVDIKSPIDRKFEEHGAGPDLLSMLLTAADYENVFFINEPLNIFREHTHSLSISESGNKLSDCYIQCKINFATNYYNEQKLYSVIAQIYWCRNIGYKCFLTPAKFIQLFGISFSTRARFTLYVEILNYIFIKITKALFGG